MKLDSFAKGMHSPAPPGAQDRRLKTVLSHIIDMLKPQSEPVRIEAWHLL
jgi:hypothetical protein